MKTRLFIGNLAATVTEGELREKFEALLSSHQNEAEVGEVEVRCKNENNYFGYVDVHLKNGTSQEVQVGTGSGGAGSRVPLFLRKYIDIMNNTKWKGSLIKVQPAKESFIEKLKKEQANRVQNDVKTEQGPQDKSQSKDYNSEQSRNSRQANDILYKLNKSKERHSRGGAGANQQFTKNDDKGGNFGFEIVTANDNSNSNQRSPPKRASTSSPKKRKRKNASSSSDDSSDDDVRDGIPKFKGLMACYPNGPPPPLTTPSVEDKNYKKGEIQEDETISEQPLIQKKLLSIAFNADDKKSMKPLEKKTFDNHNRIDSSKSVEFSGINFKKSKQQKSDMLRLQSLEKLKELKTQRSNIINSSLSSVTAIPPSSENRKEIEEVQEEIQPKSKKSTMTLFDGNDSDSGDDANGSNDKDTFNVKKQFEGETGQRLLELQTRWGNDNRFKIDNRFKESDNEDEEMEPVEQEKEKQLNILTDILGKGLTPSKPHSAASKSKVNSSKETFSSVILPRYDPEADEDPAGAQQEKSSNKSKRDKKEKPQESSDKQEEKPIRSSEPVTFKTVSNLKALFSSSGDPDPVVEDASKGTEKAGTQSGSFSLLAAFGQAHDDEDNDDGAIAVKSTSAVPRSFWQANPFRYDSSDDEDDDGKKERVKVTINRDTKDSAKPSKSADLVIHGKSPFFFSKKDPRFEGLEDYFLKEEVTVTTENGEEADNKEEKAVEDYSVKRQELKAIVKAKIRNSKRKDDKRTLAIKRTIRKRKRKLHQRGVRQI